MIVIVNYGMGNLGSVENMLRKVGEKCIVSSNKNEIKSASKLLLPGVGAFDNAIKNLKKLDLIDLLKEKVTEEKIPILGICLGMQLLTKGSEEGSEEGLDLIDAYAKKFNFKDMEIKLPVPHMGWNKAIIQKESKLINFKNETNRFYFVHSYAIQCANKENILTTTKYGYDFVSSFEKDNILGAQFHPEKSHKFGIDFFKNFSENY